MLGLSWGGCLCWYSRLLLQLSISGNDTEAWVGGDYPVIKCVCREIWSVCIKCFWLSAKVSVQRLGEGSSLPFLFYWGWEWMSLPASMVITLKTSVFFLLTAPTWVTLQPGEIAEEFWCLDATLPLSWFKWEKLGRRKEKARRKGISAMWCFIWLKPLSITCHWCSPYILQLFFFLFFLNEGLNKGTCLKEFRATNLETSIY